MQNFVTLVGHIAWPAVIIFLVWRFFPEMKSALSSVPTLAGRINKAGFVEFQPLAQQQQQQQPAEFGKEREQSTSSTLQRHRLVVPFEAHIRQNIKDQKLDGDPDFQDRLIYNLAEAVRTAQGESTTRQIFGTQLAALKQLANGPMTVAALKTLYDQHVQLAKEVGIAEPLSFLQWVSFLTSRSLAQIADDGRYAITDVGRSYLEYVEGLGVTESTKPF
jgi:hypothetical protein